ncbi:MAG: hypothetical protein J4473_04670 [Candidatus Aenigmarchaeota archaeon]|nr:hypothetical protein [Candidatus Aenigmarchaeota archaeon]
MHSFLRCVKFSASERALPKLGIESRDIDNYIYSLPVKWVLKIMYQNQLKQCSIIRHETDRPVLATALAFKCGILTMNTKHFAPAKKLVKLWKADKLMDTIDRT